MVKAPRKRQPAPAPAPPQQFAAIRSFANRRRLRSWRWLLAELLIVFLGVYGAVLADSWRERRALAAQTVRIVASLEEALRDLDLHDHNQGAAIDAMLARFDAELRQGRRPMPVFYREPGGERPPHSRFWEAVVAAGGAQILPPDLMFRFANFINNMDSFGERYVRYTQFTESRVLPLLPRGAAGFYATDGALLSEFAAHIDRLRELRALEHRLVLQANALRNHIQSLELG
jgi:hypothetical protein